MLNLFFKFFFKIWTKFLCFVPVGMYRWKLSQSTNKPKPHVLVPNSLSLWVSSYSLLPKVGYLGTQLYSERGIAGLVSYCRVRAHSHAGYENLWLKPIVGLLHITLWELYGCLCKFISNSCFQLYYILFSALLKYQKIVFNIILKIDIYFNWAFP